MKIGFIGYGEVGGILAKALKDQGVEWVGAWDILFREGEKGAALLRKAGASGVVPCESPQAMLSQADLVVSCVTASSTPAAAGDAAKSIRNGAYYLDLNSASPETKAQCAKKIDASGAHYVEAGVMTSVPPYGIRVPMVVGGKKAAELAAKLAPLGFAMEVVAEDIGVASAIKMCRSVIIKGMEAIVIESYTTARKHGVEARVLESLRETFPGLDWEKQGAYFFSRVVQHGRRRSEEMREAAVTVRETGFDPFMAAATSDKHDFIAREAAKGTFSGIASGADWREYADRLLATKDERKKSA